MNSNPFVSVVICTFGERDIFKSINAVLSSDYKNFELIVVNDGCKIKLKPEGFKVVNQKHKGLTASRNVGIKHSKGEIIAFVDDDAVAEKNWIKEMVSAFSSPETGAVGGKTIEYFDKPEENILWVCNKYGLVKVNPKKIEKEDFIVLHGCNMAFSKKALKEIDFFNESFNYYYDEIDISVRLLKKGFKIKVNEKAVVHHYIKGNVRFGNKFEFAKYKYYFALKNFNSFFFFPLLVFNDLPLALNDTKDSLLYFFNGKISFSKMLREIFFVFAGRISGTRKAFIELMS